MKAAPKFFLSFEIGNSAFDDEMCPIETARILLEIAGRIERDNELSGTVFDVNGNRIGRYELEKRA